VFAAEFQVVSVLFYLPQKERPAEDSRPFSFVARFDLAITDVILR